MRHSRKSVDEAARSRARCAYISFVGTATKGAQRVGEWHDFFLAAAGAAAVLVSLEEVLTSDSLRRFLNAF